MRETIPPSIALLVFLIIIPSALASVDVTFSSEGACMVAPHTYKLDIENNQKIRDIFSLRVSGETSDWAWIKTRRVSLDPGETTTGEISILPPAEAEMGKYKLETTVYSRTNQSVTSTRELCYIIFRNYSMEAGNFSISDENFGPGEKIRGELSVKNTGSKKFDSINATFRLVEGETTIDSVRRTFSLDLEEVNSLNFSLAVPAHQSPGEYEVNYDVRARGSVFSMEGKPVNVDPKKEAGIEERTEGNFLITTKKLTVTNRGNVRYAEPVTRFVGDPYSVLVTSEADTVQRTAGGYSYVWNIAIEPGGTTDIEYTVHYWPIYLIVGILLFLVYRGFLYLRVPTIRKRVKKTELGEDEKVFTVSLEVRNRLFGEADDVRIKDSVPLVARVIEKFDTLKPNISKSDEGTELRWNIGTMGSSEERVLHYKVKTLVQAVDHLKLPGAELEGRIAGKEFGKTSSKVKLEV